MSLALKLSTAMFILTIPHFSVGESVLQSVVCVNFELSRALNQWLFTTQIIIVFLLVIWLQPCSFCCPVLLFSHHMMCNSIIHEHYMLWTEWHQCFFSQDISVDKCFPLPQNRVVVFPLQEIQCSATVYVLLTPFF